MKSSTTNPLVNDWSQLIDDARNGCDEALGEILQRVRDYLLFVAGNEIGDPLRAKFGASDIVQFSMLEAQETIDRFRGDSESELRQWLKQIVVHNLTDEARRFTATQARSVKREVPLESSHSTLANDSLETPSFVMRRDEQDQELMQAVISLPTLQRQVVEGRHRDGLSYPQIANRLSISESYARQIWSRALQQLRSTLGSAIS